MIACKDMPEQMWCLLMQDVCTDPCTPARIRVSFREAQSFCMAERRSMSPDACKWRFGRNVDTIRRRGAKASSA